MNARTVAIVLSAILLGLGSMAHGLPRFSSRTGAKCQSCHVNPAGGAMRQVFGVQYGREKLPVPEWSSDFELEDFTNLVTNFIGLGADFRTLYFYQQQGDSSANAFWQMQGDFYLNFKPANKINLFLKKGLYSGFEIFGLLTILPARGHIKVGKFIPNYGIRTDDHTAYTRTSTGLSPEGGRPELTGLEIGIAPGAFAITGGFYNAKDGFGSGVGSEKAILGRAEGMFTLAEETFLGAGANVLTKELNGVRQTFLGGIGSFSYRNFTLLGEVDLLREASGGTTTKGLVVYAEADYGVTPGLDLKLVYDFYDPDTEEKSGSTARYSFGFEFFPITGVELRPLYRIVTEQNMEKVKNDEFHLLIHFYI